MANIPTKEKEILTPTEVAARVSSSLGYNFQDLRVEGEVTSTYLRPRQFALFTLKDKVSILKAALWSPHLGRYGNFVEDGLHVVAHGKLAAYGQRSEYQLVVDSLVPIGQGDLKKAYLKLKEKLTKEGLFELDRKRPIPSWPRVALITSPQGAAVEDFIKTALARFPVAQISLIPARVQGEGAWESIAFSIEKINLWQQHDLIVLTRGGGSLEDLWTFNEEPLVRAVSLSRLPTFAAIGHSTDLSLVEMVSDGKAITPTAAAEAIFPDLALFCRTFAENQSRLKRAKDSLIEHRRNNLSKLMGRLSTFTRRLSNLRVRIEESLKAMRTSLRALARGRREKLIALIERLKVASPRRQLMRQRELLSAHLENLFRIKNKLLSPFQLKLNRAIDNLELLSPLGILKRGYSLTTTLEGTIIKNAQTVPPNTLIRVHLAQGTLIARVLEPKARSQHIKNPQ
ncbi:MAG: exodeoxyribonuclease VII large subunit [Deltaproteobacteria bacterium]|jgi:exodeoxyribonuclease VII large subunit|nr:exodeoxyribonuclease VII large subunit [Deltaproteobacteria bacterium]